MSTAEGRSAIDAIVDENTSLRDEVDELTAERDAAEQRAAELEDALGQGAGGRSAKIGYASGGSDDEPGADDGAEEQSSAPNDLETVIAERDTYLADSQRLAADFANYRKQTDKRIADAAAAQSAGLVRNLLPVLDACDSALEQDPESPVAPIRLALLGELERSGLELLAPEIGQAFEPELHEAVMHEVGEAIAAPHQDPEDEAAENNGSGPAVPHIGEVFRAGYAWKGKVVRPAMVKVVG